MADDNTAPPELVAVEPVVIPEKLLFRACGWCQRHAEAGLRACSICRRARYCDAEHQKLAW